MEKPTPREREIRALVLEHERNGLSWASIAAREGMAPGTLSWWRSEIRRRDRARGNRSNERFVEVEIAAATLSDPLAAFELVLPDGRVLRIPPGFGVEDLRRLLAMLDGSC